ncbi:MAG: hypothetical protein P1U56_21670 [Saprospiraceae bacterium]|nr:hypothetical protein [Saprospiraceae bacterium]
MIIIKTVLCNVFLFLVIGMQAQSGLSMDMEKTMNKMQLEYIQPVEQFPTFIDGGAIKYFNYDFGLEIDGGKMLILVQTRNDDGTYIPQIAVSGLVSTLATNRQEFDIRVMNTNDKYLMETNSDWAIESLFIPKKGMTEYKIAYFKALFKEGVGAVNILYLSNEEIEVFPIVKYSNN